MDMIKNVVKRIDRHRVFQSAAQISYYNIIAFLTASAVIVYIANFFPTFINKIMLNIQKIMPSVISGVFDSAVNQVSVPKNITLVFFTTVTTIYFASRSFHGIMEAFNNIYEIEISRKQIQARAVSIFFTISIFLMIIFLFYVSVMGETLANSLFVNFGFLKLFNFLRTYGSMAVLFIIMTLVYIYLPSVKVKIKHAIPGAVFTTVIWLLLSKAFSYYISSINSFSWILGSFGSLFAFVLWLFYLSVIVLIGGEINAYIISRSKKSVNN